MLPFGDPVYAIKSKFPTPFRRDGAAFHADRWLLIAEPTERQLSEPALIVVENVESLEDPRLSRFEVSNPEALAPVAEEPAPASTSKKK